MFGFKTLITVVIASGYFHSAFAFSTIFPESPNYTQCGIFSLTFPSLETSPISGTLTMLLLPIDSPLPFTRLLEVPESGTVETSVPFSVGTQFIAVLHDDRGVANGGVSPVYTVVAPTTEEFTDAGACLIIGNSDDGNNNQLGFNLSPSPPRQCSLQTISWVSTQEQNSTISITGFVPGGNAFSLTGEEGLRGSETAVWNVNIAAGQEYLLLFERTTTITSEDGITNTFVDSQTSTIQTVVEGPNSDCVGESSPGVTSSLQPGQGQTISISVTQDVDLGSPLTTTSPVTSQTSDAQSSNEGSSSTSGFSTPILVGTILGSLLCLATIGALLFFCIRRRNRQNSTKQFRGDEETLRDSTYSQHSAESRPAIKPLMLQTDSKPIANTNGNGDKVVLPPFRHSEGFDVGSIYSRGSPTYKPTGFSGNPVTAPQTSSQARAQLPKLQTDTSPIAKSNKQNSALSAASSWSNRSDPFRALYTPQTPASAVSGAKRKLTLLTEKYRSRKEAAYSADSWGNKGRLSALASPPISPPVVGTSPIAVPTLPAMAFSPPARNNGETSQLRRSPSKSSETGLAYNYSYPVRAKRYTDSEGSSSPTTPESAISDAVATGESQGMKTIEGEWPLPPAPSIRTLPISPRPPTRPLQLVSVTPLSPMSSTTTTSTKTAVISPPTSALPLHVSFQTREDVGRTTMSPVKEEVEPKVTLQRTPSARSADSQYKRQFTIQGFAY